jgi:hypothetical protein
LGNLELARRIVAFGILKSRHKKKARISLYHARMVWRKIVQEYMATLQGVHEERTQAAQEQQIQPEQAEQPHEEVETAA